MKTVRNVLHSFHSLRNIETISNDTETPNYYNIHVHKEVMHRSLFTAQNKKGNCNGIVVEFVSHNSDFLTPTQFCETKSELWDIESELCGENIMSKNVLKK